MKWLFSLWFLGIGSGLFAQIPSADEITKLIQTANIKKIKRGFAAYKEQIEEHLDQESRANSQAFKTLEEKKDYGKKVWNRRDALGLTPLHWALLLRDDLGREAIDLMALLFEYGADPAIRFPVIDESIAFNIITNIKYTNLAVILKRIATSSSEMPVMFLIADRSDMGVFNLFLNKLSQEAIRDARITRFSPSFPDQKFDLPPLHFAFWSLAFDYAQALIVAGVDVTQAAGHDQGTPLHYLFSAAARQLRVRKGERRMFQEIGSGDGFQHMHAVAYNQKLFAKLLIERGADPRVKTQVTKQSALDLLRIMGDRRLIQTVIELSARYGFQDLKDWAESYLVEQEGKRIEIENSLLQLISEQEKQIKKFQAVSNAGLLVKGKRGKRQNSANAKGKNEIVEAVSAQEEGDEPFLPVCTSVFEDDFSSPWEVVQRGRTAQRAERSEIVQEKEEIEVAADFERSQRKTSFIKKRILVNQQLVTIELSEHFRDHVAQRHAEVGSHDVSDDDIMETLEHPTVVIRKTASDRLRYVFLAPSIEGDMFIRVVISKKARESSFKVITAYRKEKASLQAPAHCGMQDSVQGKSKSRSRSKGQRAS